MDTREIIGEGNGIPYIQDYVSPDWSKKSFYFDGVNNIFSGDATISTAINNCLVGANKQFTISLWVKRLASGATQILFCRDNSTTNIRQFIVFYNNVNKFQVTLYTNATNSLTLTSTATFTELREWNNFVIVYDGTKTALTRLTLYRNSLIEPSTTTQAGAFTTINNTSVNNVNIGGRSTVANFSKSYINQVAVFNTNLSAANVGVLFNKRVPFDIRKSSLNSSLALFLSADTSSSFSANWTWTDLISSGNFTSLNMVSADLYADAPALKQITIELTDGQSNGTGRVDMINLPERFIGSLPWLKIFDGTNMVNIDSTLNNNQRISPSNQYGVEFYLGEYINQNFKKTVYIAKISQGGTCLNYDAAIPNWAPGLGALWTALNTDIAALKEWELANGFTITKINYLWLQGEKDSEILAYANSYQTNWTNFLTGNVTNSIFAAKLLKKFYIQPFLYDCLLSVNQNNSAYLYKNTVNTAKKNVQATNPNYYRTINTDYLPVNPTDGAHYTDRAFKVMAKLIGRLMNLDLNK